MPVYEYECEKCEKTFEYLEPMLSRLDSRNRKKACPECGAEMKKKIASVFGRGCGTSLGFSPKGG